MVCASKRIAVEVHNVAVHDRDLIRTLPRLNSTTLHLCVVCHVYIYIYIYISILECTRAGAQGNKPNEALL